MSVGDTPDVMPLIQARMLGLPIRTQCQRKGCKQQTAALIWVGGKHTDPEPKGWISACKHHSEGYRYQCPYSA